MAAGGLLAGLVTSPFSAVPPAAASTVPAGFSDQLVAGVGSPTAFAFTPDRRMLVTTQGGQVRIVQQGALLATPAIDLSAKLCSNSERGLLGVAVDPQFATSHYVFLYYSFMVSPSCDATTVNRVSRFVMTGNSLAGETVLIDNIPSPAGNHNGGDLVFGPGDLLYVSVGDGGCDYAGGGCGAANDASRDLNALVGKVLRITRDGGVPAGNPFTGAGTASCKAGVVAASLKCQETFAWGFRNPYRFAIDASPADPRIYVDDVGQSTWEEIDVALAGHDYGWNVREGHCATGSTTDCGPPPAGMTNPIFDYGRSDGCVTITGGAFVPAGVWPAAFDNRYLFADFGCGKIFRLDPSGGGFTRTDVFTGLGSSSVVHLGFGPWRDTQALYYTTYAGGGQVRRIAYVPGSTAGDYDRDGRADVGVFRPSTGVWYLDGVSPPTVSLGQAGDVPVPGDYGGDGRTAPAVYRPSTGTWFTPANPVAWGVSGDIPVPGDYDGDGRTDVAVFRPSTGVWYLDASTAGPAAVAWGVNGDVPVPADYDGDGRTDLAVFRPSTGTWYLDASTAGPWAAAWGVSGDTPVPADYDGDGRTDLAVFRPSTGTWYLTASAAAGGGGPEAVAWGVPGDTPVPADYDGDGDADLAVFRPSTNTWYLATATPAAVSWGAAGDIALTAPATP